MSQSNPSATTLSLVLRTVSFLFAKYLFLKSCLSFITFANFFYHFYISSSKKFGGLDEVGDVAFDENECCLKVLIKGRLAD